MELSSAVPGSVSCGHSHQHWSVAPPRLFSLPETVISSKRSLWSQLAIAAGSAAAIVVAANISRPYYMSRKPIASQLIEHTYVDSSANRAPWLSGPAEVALATPQFLLDREL